MPVDVILPKVDMDMTTGIIEAWKVREGQQVREGDVLFEISTNKAVMEIDAPQDGIIRQISDAKQAALPVGTVVARIYQNGEALVELPPQPRAAADIELRKGAIVACHWPRPPQPAPANNNGQRATPYARKLAREADIQLANLRGSGPQGRISGADVLQFQRTQQFADDPSLVPMTAARRIAAQRLTESYRTAPHFHLTAQIDMSGVNAFLKGAASNGAGKISTTVLIAALAGRVLRAHPMLNASADNEHVRIHSAINIAVAMERAGDLVTPVLHHADRTPLTDLNRQFHLLRMAAQDRSIRPSQMADGTFTISNLGMYGVDSFTAIINPPQSAILAVGRTVDTPVGRDGKIVLRPMANFCLSSDHRIVDGVTAARFMADLRAALENPAKVV